MKPEKLRKIMTSVRVRPTWTSMEGVKKLNYKASRGATVLNARPIISSPMWAHLSCQILKHDQVKFP